MSYCVVDDSVETVVTCTGHLDDLNFDERFGRTVATLRRLICTNSDDRKFRISKVEPWNSVRVTFSLGQDAAERLRILAGEAGGEVLARLGILSVQLRPSEQVISIRVAAANAGTSLATAVGTSTPIGSSPNGSTPVGAAPSASPGAAPIVAAPVNAPIVGSHAPQLPIVPNAGLHKPAMLGPPAPPVVAKVLAHAQTPITPPGIPQVQIPGASNRQFPYPQTPQTPHHIQIQQSKAVGNHYPPPPYPGAMARPSVLSTASSVPESKIADVEAASPLLVNLLQNDATSQNGSQNIVIGHQQAQCSLPPNPVAAPSQSPIMIGAAPRGFASTSAPQAVVHHRPSTVRTQTPVASQASVGSQGPVSAPAVTQGPVATQTPLNQVPMSTQVQTGPLLHQNPPPTQTLLQHQQVSVVQAPPVTPQVRAQPPPVAPVVATSSIPTLPPVPQPPPRVPAQPSPVEEEKPRSPSPPPSTDLTSSGKARQYLINPLTGVLEPMSSESSDEDEVEPAEFPPSPEDLKSDLEDSPVTPNSNSMGLGSMMTPTHSTPSVPLVPQIPPIQMVSNATMNSSVQFSTVAAMGTQPMSASMASANQQAEEVRGAADKLKLRLKLDKSAPYNVCYTTSAPGVEGRLGTSMNTMTPGPNVVPSAPTASEPRVPPLHISLRGRNAAVVTRCRERKRDGKTRKRSEVPLPPAPSASTTAAQTTPEPPPALSPLRPPAPTSPLVPITSPVAPPTPMAPTICVSAYPSEAEVASILRSVPEVTTDEKKRKRSHPKSTTPLRPQLEDKRRKVVNSTAAHSTPASGSYVKTLIKHLAKDHPRIDKVDRDREREQREREREQREREQREREAKKEEVVSTTSTATSTTSSSPETTNVTTVVPSLIGNVRSKSTEYQCKSPPSSAPPQSVTPQSSPQVVPSYPAKLSPGDKAPGIDKAGEDSGIESMDALSEKSPNRGDSPNRKEEVIKKEVVLIKAVGENVDEIVDEDSVEDPVPIRITPALYTYSNPDKQREGSPPLEIGKGEYPTSRSRSNSLSNSKSLLEQLLIEIPNNETVTRRSSTSSATSTVTTPSTANGRNHRLSTNRSPEEAPVVECPAAPPSPVKRGRKASESSTASHDEAPTTRSKRKCSENATELIKACIGVNTGTETSNSAVSVNNSSAATVAPPVPTPPPPTPVVPEEPKKRKVEPAVIEEEEVTEKRPALTEELTRTRSKDEEKIKTTTVVGRRSARQEVKRTSTTNVHRKRTRPEDVPVPAATESKLRRRTAAKESAK